MKIPPIFLGFFFNGDFGDNEDGIISREKFLININYFFGNLDPNLMATSASVKLKRVSINEGILYIVYIH